jgi:hypothetical protein
LSHESRDTPLKPEFSSALNAVIQAILADSAIVLDPSTSAPFVAVIRSGPETFADAVLFPWQQSLAAAVSAAFPDGPPERRDALTFLYQHADFVWHHLEHLFQQYEGVFACSDKARWVLDSYQAQCEGKPLRPWPPDPRRYWHPHTQSLTFWLGVIQHLERLYFGDSTAYLADLKVLES